LTSIRHILIVDDCEDDRELYSLILRSKGYRVSEAADGEEGLAEAAKLRPDLILMDLWLPKTGGWEATKRLREDARTKHIPIIILSAHSFVRATSLGDGYLIKPCIPDDLLAEINRVLAHDRHIAA